MTTPQWVSESVPHQVDRAAVLRRLELDVVRRLDGRLSGDHHTTDLGPGSERSGAREYQPGDDARRIDWNLTARSHVAHVRTTEADRELETWVVADRSASLDFGTADREKRDVALGVAASFGVITARAGNRFGVLACGGPTLARRPAAGGRAAMLSALAMLYDTPRLSTQPTSTSDLTAALLTLPRLQPRRGLVVVVSDFLDDTDWPHALRALSLRQQVIAVRVVDSREAHLPDVGMLSVVDPESGRLLHVNTRSAALRERYAQAAIERDQRITSHLQAAQVEILTVSTDRDWLTDVIRFAVARRDKRRSSVLGRTTP